MVVEGHEIPFGAKDALPALDGMISREGRS
jgi:hypothetical protein